MKEDILHFLQNMPESKSECFNGLFELYRKSPYKNIGSERMFNAVGCTDETVNVLKYELMQMHDIKEVELFSAQNKVVQLFKVPEFILNFSENELGNWVKDGCKGIDSDVNEFVQLCYNNNAEEIAVIVKKALSEIEVNTSARDTESVKIRNEYPFLSDPDCPNEFKILISDKITAYHLMMEAKGKLQLVADGELQVSEEEKQTLSKAIVDHFETNRLIHEELDYYAKNKTVLGKHPLFAQLTLEREVNEMSTEELMSFKSSSPKYFSDNNKKLEAAKKENNTDKVSVLKERIKVRGQKLKLVDKKLGLGKKKIF